MFAIKDNRGWISEYGYKSLREPLYRARIWKTEATLNRFLTTAFCAKLARHTTSGDWEIHTVKLDPTQDHWHRKTQTGKSCTPFRTISQAELQSIITSHGLKKV